MPAVKHAVIAAAGLGSRLGQGKPKCLVNTGRGTILAHLLDLLKDVEDVRVVVGFMENDVIAEITKIRRDVIIVRNPDFRNTTTLHSYVLGAEHINADDCLFMDADLLIVPSTFNAFLQTCKPAEARLAITEAKTKDAVYVELNDKKQVVEFSRTHETPFEWANISWLPTHLLKPQDNTNVYTYLSNFLPIWTTVLEAYEIDTESDLQRALSHLERIFSPVLT